MSKTVDLVISGGTIVSPESSFQGSIAIQDGMIVEVGADSRMPDARDVIDAKGKHLLPGAIDSHVHFREPGFTHKEDWRTGSTAAAFGGVTTVMEMPNTNPPIANVEALKIKQAAAAKGAYVDYGLYGLIVDNNLDQIEPLIENGVACFKIYLSESATGQYQPPHDGIMLEAFEIIARRGIRCAVHAENGGIIGRREKILKEAQRHDPLAHQASRPVVAATESVSRSIIFAEWTGCRIHIAHESSGDGLYLIEGAKARGVDITVETCPQYLLLTTEHMKKMGGITRCNPPIREPGHDEKLWKALHAGTVDMIATDHAPHTPEEKIHANIWHCHCGLPGIETQMPLMLNEVNRGRMTINQYVLWSSVNPAKAWSIYPTKGAIQVGSDADIAIVDMNHETAIDREKLHSKGRLSPFHGWAVKGVPIATIVRGRPVVRDGKLVGEAGWGKPIRQTIAPGRPRNTDQTSAAIVRAPKY
ncbi:MAG: allantoinase AllB [Rhodospirillales bacterium]|nr:allantoinase AllB [Rhodospirillales bacterium]